MAAKNAGAGRRVGRPADQVDGRPLVGQLVHQPLYGGQNLHVMLGNEVLQQLLQLLAIKLEQRFADRDAQLNGQRLADAVKGEGDDVLAPEEVVLARVAGAGDGGDFTAKREVLVIKN